MSRRRAGRPATAEPAERQGKRARTAISLDDWVAQDKPSWQSEEDLREGGVSEEHRATLRAVRELERSAR